MIAGFGSQLCIWRHSETLESVFHRVFMWHPIGGGIHVQEDEVSSPVICQMEALMKTRFSRLSVPVFLEKSCTVLVSHLEGVTNESKIEIYAQRSKADQTYDTRKKLFSSPCLYAEKH